MKARAALVLLVLAAAAAPSRAGDDGAYAKGSLAWVSSDRLDLVGDVSAEIPFGTAGPWRFATFLRAVTAIQKSTSDFTFIVDRVSYEARFLARRPIGSAGQLEVFAGELGMSLVDEPGRARVRVAGLGWESPGFHDAFGPFGWSGAIRGGAVVEHSGVDASAVVSGEVRYLAHLPSARMGIGGDATVDALVGADGGADVTVGPRYEIDLTGERRFGVFARWLRSRNPLGIEADGWLAGFDFAQGPNAGRERPAPPEIFGAAATGVGDDRRALVRLDIHVVTPPFLGGTIAEVEVDGNVLTADDRNDLFYLYDVGIAHALDAWRAGVWFFHRSNHVLDGANPEIASINVLEAGIESGGWDRAEPGGFQGRAGYFDARLRAGWLIDSTFGQDESWHARAGARWSSPPLGATHVYASAQVERGDVGGSAYSVGALLPRGWDLRLEARHDEQLFAADKRAKLFIATLRY